MRRHEKELEELAAKVLVVTFESGPQVQDYVRETGLPWPLVIDESRALYHGYGMARGRWRDIWGLASWRAYAKLLLKGERLRKSHGDVRQLGGDIVIDPAGIVRFHHVSENPADRPSITSMLDAIRTHMSNSKT